MFCTNCGKEIADGSVFCTHCGANLAPAPQAAPSPFMQAPTSLSDAPAPVAEAPVVPPVVEAPVVPPVVEAPAAEPVEEPPIFTPAPAPAPEKKEKAKKEKSGKKKFPVALVIILSVVALLIGAIAFVVCKLFPLEVSMIRPDNTVTYNGVISSLDFTITANQPIKEVKYAVNPTDSNNMEEYTDATISGTTFEKKMTVTDITVEPGSVEMYIYVKTIFGEHKEQVTLTCVVGNVAAPDPNSIVQLDEDTKVVCNEIIVTLAEGNNSTKAKNLAQSYGGEVVGAIYILNQYQIRFQDISLYELEEKLEQLQAEECVEYATYNTVIEETAAATPNDPDCGDWNVNEPNGENWHLECIDAPGAWDHQASMSTVKIGIIDSCLNYSHEDLKVNSGNISFLPTDDFPTMQSLLDYYDEWKDAHVCINPPDERCIFCAMKDHGSHVAGIIGAVADNNTGTCGTNWNANLYFTNAWYYTKYGDGQLLAHSTDASLSYNLAVLAMRGCRVINMSIGASEPSVADNDEEKLAARFDRNIKTLEDAGYDFLIVKAAGNTKGGADASNYALNRILTSGENAKKHTIIVANVAHTTIDWTPIDIIPTQYNFATSSHYGDLVDIAAPGTNVYSTILDGYGYMTGTSMAAPVVSGVASMLYGVDSSLTAEQVKNILCENVETYTSKNGKLYPIVNAHIAVESVLDIDNAEEPTPVPEVGFFTGIVQDAATQEIIEDANVIVTNDATGEQYFAAILNNGTYYLYAEAGTYTMEFSAPGYLSETIYNVPISTGVVTYNVLLNMVPDEPSFGWASGHIVDAFDASHIPNATITVMKGIDNRDGEVISTLTADENGYYSLTLDPGNYTLLVTAEGYANSTTSIIVVADRTRDNQDCSMTPVLGEGEMRIVLTWGEYPSDLDSHLVGPTPDGYDFHIAYYEMNYYYDGEKYVNLDVDDTTSFGPETTSVYNGVPGEAYTFYVHDYSNRYDDFSTAIATSGAVVKVYVGGQDHPYTFYAPSGDGTLWAVFSIQDGNIIPINEMSYETTPREVGQ